MKASDYLRNVLNEYIKHGINVVDALAIDDILDPFLAVGVINAIWCAMRQLSGGLVALSEYERSCSREECIELLEFAIDISLTGGFLP